MGRKELTKTFAGLRGFSTVSPFIRPANVADKAVNLQRLPDGTFSPRRGYQCYTSEKGGFGISVFEDIDGNQQVVTIGADGVLYLQQDGILQITFSPTSRRDWFSFEVKVDTTQISDTTLCDYDPYAVVEWQSLVTDCLQFTYTRKTSVLVDGNQSAVNIIEIDTGSTVEVGASVTFIDQITGEYVTRTVTAIDTVSSPPTITIDGDAVDVNDNDNIDALHSDSACLGKGFQESSPYSIGDLKGFLDAVTDVSTTITGESQTPAAFIPIQESTVISKDTSSDLEFHYWKDANRTVSSPFAGLIANISDEDFENPSFAAYDHLLFIANKYDNVQKFDGQTVYLAGLPKGAAPTGLQSGTGITGTFKWFTTYEQEDHSGRLLIGTTSDAFTDTLANASEDLTITTLKEGSGYNTNAATVNGSQVGVNTIAVTANHTLQEGDTAFFLDGVTGLNVTRNIDSRTNTSITIAGDAVNVLNGAIISNNLRVNLYRTVDGGAGDVIYLLGTFPNDPNNDISYSDNTTDANLAANFLRVEPPIIDPNPPPKVAYLANYGNQIIYAGDPTDLDVVYFSEPNIPEAVDQVENSFIVPSNNDNISGLGTPEGYLVVFKDHSIYSVSGDLSTSKYTIRPVASGSNIGCISHHSIQTVGTMTYFLHTNGVYSMTATQLYPLDKFGNPVALSIAIDRFFRDSPFNKNDRFILKRSTSINYTKDNQYLLFLPVEPSSTSITQKVATTKSRVLSYDYQGKNWFEWTNVNAAAGWYVLYDNLYWQERRIDNGNVVGNQYKQHRKYRLTDQVDHVTPIHVTWRSSWEDKNQPRIRKTFTRAVLLLDVISGLQQKNDPNLCFTSYKDWIPEKFWTSKTLEQVFNSSAFSTSQFSYSPWDGYQDSFITINLRSSQVAKSCQIQLQLNELNTMFALQGFQLELSSDNRLILAR